MPPLEENADIPPTPDERLEQALGISLAQTEHEGEQEGPGSRGTQAILTVIRNHLKLLARVPSGHPFPAAADLEAITTHPIASTLVKEIAALLAKAPPDKATAIVALEWAEENPLALASADFAKAGVSLAPYCTRGEFKALLKDDFASDLEAFDRFVARLNICFLLESTSWGRGLIRSRVIQAFEDASRETYISRLPHHLLGSDGIGKYMDGEQLTLMIMWNEEQDVANADAITAVLVSPSEGVPARHDDLQLHRILESCLLDIAPKYRTSLLVRHSEILDSILGEDTVRSLIEQSIADVLAAPDSNNVRSLFWLLANRPIQRTLGPSRLAAAHLGIGRLLASSSFPAVFTHFCEAIEAGGLKEMTMTNETLEKLALHPDPRIRVIPLLHTERMHIISADDARKIEEEGKDPAALSRQRKARPPLI